MKKSKSHGFKNCFAFFLIAIFTTSNGDCVCMVLETLKVFLRGCRGEAWTYNPRASSAVIVVFHYERLFLC